MFFDRGNRDYNRMINLNLDLFENRIPLNHGLASVSIRACCIPIMNILCYPFLSLNPLVMPSEEILSQDYGISLVSSYIVSIYQYCTN